MAGRLFSYSQFGKSIQATSFVLDVIGFGNALPFYETPPPTPILGPRERRVINNASAHNQTNFVSFSISELLDACCIKLCANQPYIVNPLSVSVQKSGKR